MSTTCLSVHDDNFLNGLSDKSRVDSADSRENNCGETQHIYRGFRELPAGASDDGVAADATTRSGTITRGTAEAATTSSSRCRDGSAGTTVVVCAREATSVVVHTTSTTSDTSTEDGAGGTGATMGPTPRGPPSSSVQGKGRLVGHGDVGCEAGEEIAAWNGRR